jgi:hypothetical protein
MNSTENTATVAPLTDAETAQVAGGAAALIFKGYCPCTSGNPISFANFASQVVNPVINAGSLATRSF